MSNINKKLHVTDQKGFSLIETLVGVLILAVVSLTLHSLINFTLKTIWESKARVTATQLANQKIEMARNLDYEDVGTISGIPAGNIPSNEIISRNGINYTVQTEISYIDDPFDGTLGGDPDDTLNTDYKKIRVEVSWNYRLQNEPVVLMSNIVPPGLESSVGGGTLKILVYDAGGAPVPQANVTIDNTDVNPIIDIDTVTDDNGYLILPGSPESIENYEITITKAGYSTNQTYNTTVELPSPEKPHASVFEAQTTNISFAIDQTSNINVWVQNESGILLSGITFDVQGAKTIGLDGDAEPVYKYDQQHITNAGGRIFLTNIEWNSYTFSMSESSYYNISETIPVQPIDLLPDTSRDLTITLTPSEPFSALIITKDINGQPLADAEVRFYTTSLDQTLTTDESGQVYFTPWEEVESTLEITLDGYEYYEDTFDISGYHIEEVIMTMP